MAAPVGPAPVVVGGAAPVDTLHHRPAALGVSRRPSGEQILLDEIAEFGRLVRLLVEPLDCRTRRERR